MKIGYLTHFHPNETHYVDIRRKPPVEGLLGTIYIHFSFWFWSTACRLHLTDWGHPRFLTVVGGSYQIE